MKKKSITLALLLCLVFALCITAGAISFATESHITGFCHYVPLLEDSATGTPGQPGGTYDYNSLYSMTTVTAYNNNDSVTASQNCYDNMYVLEGWTDHTSATAKIRSIQSASGTFKLGSNSGYTTQSRSWVKPN